MRRTCHGKRDWVDIKWNGGVLTHPVQQDGSSCGVIVVLVSNKCSVILMLVTSWFSFVN